MLPSTLEIVSCKVFLVARVSFEIQKGKISFCLHLRAYFPASSQQLTAIWGPRSCGKKLRWGSPHWGCCALAQTFTGEQLPSTCQLSCHPSSFQSTWISKGGPSRRKWSRRHSCKITLPVCFAHPRIFYYYSSLLISQRRRMSTG